MDRIILSKNQISELVFANRYPIDEKTKFLNLTFPDDEAQIDLILETANVYGFSADRKKCLEVFVETIGGQKDFVKRAKLYKKDQFSAVVQIRGNYGILPRKSKYEVFIFHETLASERHRVLAKKLIEQTAVTLFPGCDEEYLYEALSDMTDSYLYETVARLGKGLPIYYVEFDTEGLFTIDEMGKA